MSWSFPTWHSSNNRIPGEQTWAKHEGSDDLAESLASLSLNTNDLPDVVKDKHPLPSRGTDYTGALLKVYDADFSPSPASAYDVIGIVSAAPIPTPYGAEDEEPALVPAIHAILPPVSLDGGAERPSDAESAKSTRAALVSYLANAFSPADEVAAELLLLALLARPAVRLTALPPLGTLSLNLIRSRSTFPSALEERLASLAPSTLHLPLTLPLLHEARFRPVSADGTSLAPGLLQLTPGTLLVLDEDGLGSGGALNEAALKNLQALGEALETQSVRYEYPFMDALKIESHLRAVITGEGKSLLPVDITLPVTVAGSAESVEEAQLVAFRDYIAAHGGKAHAEALAIPDDVAAAVQDGFVAERKAGKGSVEAAESRLKRRMKIARLLALSHPEAELSSSLWERTLELDGEIERREAEREAKRREAKLGAPAAAALEKEETPVATESGASSA